MYDPQLFVAHSGRRTERHLDVHSRPEKQQQQREEIARRRKADASGSAVRSSMAALSGQSSYRSTSAPGVLVQWEEEYGPGEVEDLEEIVRHSSHLLQNRRGRRSSGEKYAPRRELRFFGRQRELDPPTDFYEGILPEYVKSGNSRVSLDRDLAGKRRVWCFNDLASENPSNKAAESAAGELKGELSSTKARQKSPPEEKTQHINNKEPSRLISLRHDAELAAAESPRLRRCFPRPFRRLTRAGRAHTGRVYAAPQTPKLMSAPSPSKSLSIPPIDSLMCTEKKQAEQKQKQADRQVIRSHRQCEVWLAPAMLEGSRGSSLDAVKQVEPTLVGGVPRIRTGASCRRSSSPEHGQEKGQVDRRRARTRRSVDAMCIPNLGALEWDALEVIRSGPGSKPRNLLKNRNALDYPSTALARVATCNILGCIP